MDAKKICPNCKAILKPDAIFCYQCGADVKNIPIQDTTVEEVKENITVCPICKKEIKTGSRFCIFCGATIATNSSVAKKDDKVIMTGIDSQAQIMPSKQAAQDVINDGIDEAKENKKNVVTHTRQADADKLTTENCYQHTGSIESGPYYYDNPDTTISDKFFCSRGRISREAFIKRICPLILVFFFIERLRHGLDLISCVVLTGIMLMILYSAWCLGVRRRHDLGSSGSAFSFVGIKTFFSDGVSGPNMYGPDPLKKRF